MSAESGTSRRGFLVALGAMIIGRFKLPGFAATPAASGSLAGIPPLASPEPIRRVITTPRWSPDHELLLWSELQDDGSVSTKLWQIENEEEREEADRFYALVTWRRWSKESQLHTLVMDPGPWLIRWNHDGLYGWQFRFLRVADWDYLFGPGSLERVCFSKDPTDKDVLFVADPATAALCTSAQVLPFVHQLMRHYDMSVERWDYFEPVLPKDAYRDFRAETFSLLTAKLEVRS